MLNGYKKLQTVWGYHKYRHEMMREELSVKVSSSDLNNQKTQHGLEASQKKG